MFAFGKNGWFKEPRQLEKLALWNKILIFFWKTKFFEGGWVSVLSLLRFFWKKTQLLRHIKLQRLSNFFYLHYPVQTSIKFIEWDICLLCSVMISFNFTIILHSLFIYLSLIVTPHATLFGIGATINPINVTDNATEIEVMATITNTSIIVNIEAKS